MFAYDTWGGSWGTSWGGSWGTGGTPPVVVKPKGGGIGHAKRKRKPIWIEEDGKILVFRNASDASEYLAQQKPSYTPKKYKPVVIDLVVDIPSLKTYESRLQVEFEDLVKVPEHATDLNIAMLVELARRVQEWIDEEDEVIILLYS